jgi:hypothetical protein
MSEDKALRTKNFDGKTSSYVNWSKRSQSLCTIKDCDQALLQDYADNLIHDETGTLDSSDSNFTLVKSDLNHKLTISVEDLTQDMRQVYNQTTNSTFLRACPLCCSR